MTGIGGERGFTLVELLVAMVIGVIVLGGTLSVLETFQTNSRYIQLRNENQSTARNTLDRLSRQLRNVIARTTSSGTVPGALEQAEEYGITFETVDTTKSSSGENKLNAMRVRYCLEDSNAQDEVLWEEVKRWTTSEAPEVPSSTACPDTNTKDWEKWAKVVQNVTNRVGGGQRPLFTYSAKETPEILAVNVSMFVNVSPEHARPGESELTTGVSLRNANRRPIAEFTATEEGNRTVRLNASASYDPDGLSLTYKWWQNGVELPTRSQEYVTNQAFAAKTTQTFTLEVTNPGGLSATTTKTVKIE